jgi:hypothetical protein
MFAIPLFTFNYKFGGKRAYLIHNGPTKSFRLSVYLSVCPICPPLLALFTYLLQKNWNVVPYESYFHKNRVSTGKRALECDLCSGVHTLKGPYESTLHKNRLSTGKRVLECDLCSGLHTLKGPYKSTLHKNRVSTGKKSVRVRALPRHTLPPPPPVRTLEGPCESTLHKNGDVK